MFSATILGRVRIRNKVNMHHVEFIKGLKLKTIAACVYFKHFVKRTHDFIQFWVHSELLQLPK